MATVQIPPEQRFVCDLIPWRGYERLLRAFEGRHVRITYDRGTVEIMILSFEHECYKRLLGRMIEALTEEFGLPLVGGGAMTFKLRRRRRGLEGDESFWIASEPLVHGKIKIDLSVAPPPDLVVEIDITSSSLDRMTIYAVMRVPEVWRFDGTALTFHILGADGKYTVAPVSRAFPQVLAADLVRFLALRPQTDENAVIRQFRAWVRQQLVGGTPPPAAP